MNKAAYLHNSQTHKKLSARKFKLRARGFRENDSQYVGWNIDIIYGSQNSQYSIGFVCMMTIETITQHFECDTQEASDLSLISMQTHVSWIRDIPYSIIVASLTE